MIHILAGNVLHNYNMSQKPQNKTQATKASVKDFLASVANEERRKDAEVLVRLMRTITGKPAVMWGPSIVGFDRVHYKYPSGREGDICAIGFSPRSNAQTLYLATSSSKYAPLLKKLGPHQTSKACLYIKRLSDVDMGVLEALIKNSYEYVMSHEDAMHRTE
jgi:hypothetical protein